MVKPFTPEVLDRVQRAIEAAEKATSGELRVVVAAHTVTRHLLAGAGLGLVAAAVAIFFAWRLAWGYPEPLELGIAAALGLLIGGAASWIASKIGIDRRVRRHAERDFLRLGIGKTHEHTGALLMLSMEERRAVLLADQGIHQKVADGTWDGIVQRLTAGMREGRYEEALVKAIGEIGAQLATHFPQVAEKKNELPDDVVVE